jgi:hypothetical protein
MNAESLNCRVWAEFGVILHGSESAVKKKLIFINNILTFAYVCKHWLMAAIQMKHMTAPEVKNKQAGDDMLSSPAFRSEMKMVKT